MATPLTGVYILDLPLGIIYDGCGCECSGNLIKQQTPDNVRCASLADDSQIRDSSNSSIDRGVSRTVGIPNQHLRAPIYDNSSVSVRCKIKVNVEEEAVVGKGAQTCILPTESIAPYVVPIQQHGSQ